MPYGTLSVSDLLAANQQSIARYGEDKAFEAIQNGLDAHNEIVKEMISDLCEVSDVRLTRYGGDGAMDMVEVDEFGSVDASKILPGSNVGFPLRKQMIAIQWTRTYMQTHTPQELAGQFTAAQDADVRRIRRDIARAFFKPTNVLTYTDNLTDRVVLPIRALLNADGAAIPYGPNGETFDGTTHTHYLGTAALVAANVSALIETVLEHRATAQIKLYANRAQEAAIRAMANFTPYYDPRLTIGETITRATGPLDMTNLYDRAIGTFDSAEVWIQPWVPANYILAVDPYAPVKPLRIRTRTGTLDGLGALNIDADHEHAPLRANSMSREYGIAALTRFAGAALFTTSATYANPVIA